MKLNPANLCLRAVLLANIAVALSAAASDPQLGDPPVRPKDLSGLPRRLQALTTGGFTVNTTNREEVRSFYNAIYPASDNIAINSTANTASCVAGTNSVDFKDAVLRRINWFRAMAGIAANVTLDSGFNSSNQLAALIMSASTNLSHTPTNGGIWHCWSIGGSNAASSSNIAIGTDGPDAVTGYIQDPGANNAAAGHRRWLLYPQTQIMGTGDIPRQGTFMAANAIWIFDGHGNDPRPATRNRYVAWPPSGFMPKQAVFPRWSFAYTNADFTGATISMTSNGIPVSIMKETVVTGFGENTLVWVPMGLDSTNFLTTWPFNGTDTVYTVAVSNVLFGAAVSNFNYSVTVFDPAKPGAGYFPPTISGPAQPFLGQSNAYAFNSVSNSTSYQWRYAQRLSFSLADGAEAGLANWTTNTEADYPVIATTPVALGTHAFQLVHSHGNPQIMTLNYSLSPLANASIQFKSRLEAATADETARLQISTNAGASWFDVFTQVGAGTNSPGEAIFTSKNISLGSYAGNSLAVRFLFDLAATAIFYTGPPSSVGWHFDDITITNAEQLLTPVTNGIAGTNFLFNPPVLGNYDLQARGVIFTDFPLDWGPVKQIAAVVGPPVLAINKITVSNSQTRIDFTLQSGSASTYKLLTAPQPSGAWSTDNVAVLTTNSPGSYRFTTTPSGNVRFYRVQTP